MNTHEASLLLEAAIDTLNECAEVKASQARDALITFRDGWFRRQREREPRHPPKAPGPPERRRDVVGCDCTFCRRER